MNKGIEIKLIKLPEIYTELVRLEETSIEMALPKKAVSKPKQMFVSQSDHQP